MQGKIQKYLTILLLISGTYVIYTLIASFLVIPLTDFYWLAYSIDFLFFASALASFELFFWILLIVFIVLAVFDFLCSYYIPKRNKKFKKVAFYRSLITCLFGIFLVILGIYVLVPHDLESTLVTVEGGFYFIFYGAILYLLMLSERRTTE